ncbi:hypothetical protein GCK32_013579 [Trichostrongylus colubriformis]|uniref:Uncharacterized protein n=1 Tax=Trichostrongylus colubriformis TaxID=6319 RepID=A0AAN8J1Q9_TRICO
MSRDSDNPEDFLEESDEGDENDNDNRDSTDGDAPSAYRTEEHGKEHPYNHVQQPDLAEQLSTIQSAIIRLTAMMTTNQDLLRELDDRISVVEQITQQLLNLIKHIDEQHGPALLRSDAKETRRAPPPSTSRRPHSNPTCPFCNGNHWASDCGSALMSTPIPLKSLKQKLTRQLNALSKLIEEAEVYSPTWTFPTRITDFKQFAASHKKSITTLKQEIADQADKIEAFYDLGLPNVHTTDDKTAEEAFNEYWEESEGDAILSLAITMIHLLTKRLSELLCQELLANEQNNTATRIPPQQKLEKKFIHQSNSNNVARLMIVSLRVRNPY